MRYSLYCKLVFLFFAFFPALHLPASPKKDKNFLYNRLDQIVENAREKWQVPGVAIAVIKNGKITYAKGYGYRDLATKKPVTPETVFQIGSISKSFTATLASMLVDEKKCTWETPVQEIVPEFLLQDEWTTKHFLLEDLFAQKSGLPTKTGDMQALLGYNPEEIIYNLRFIAPKHSFRSTYSYQNVFYLLAGKSLERMTNKPFKDLLQEKILTPLQMNDTLCSFEEYLEKENRASFYALVNGSTTHIPDSAPFLRKVNDYLPAGGLHSNVVDLTKWLDFQINNGRVDDQQLVAKKQIQKIRRPQIYVKNIGKKPSYYGLGWSYTQSAPRPFIWHNGETFGVKSIAAFIPEEKLGIVVLTNLRSTMAPEGIVWDFLDAYFGKKSRDWTNYFYKQEQKKAAFNAPSTACVRPCPFSDYIGTYQHEIYGEARILQEKDHLVLQLGPESSRLFLYPQKRDQFSVYWPTGGLKKNGIHFFRNQQGKVQKMSFALFSEDSSAEFTRFSDESPALFGYL